MKHYAIYYIKDGQKVIVKYEYTRNSAVKYIEYLKTLPEYVDKNLFIMV